METLTDQNWLLTVGTFLPLVGALAIMFLTGKDDDETPKLIGIATAGATLVIGVIFVGLNLLSDLLYTLLDPRVRRRG